MRPFLLVVFLMCTLQEAHALVIVEQTDAQSETALSIVGQSFTTPAGSAIHQLVFSWFDDPGNPATTAINPGVLFLLDQEYLGLPGDLSSSTPGYIAEHQLSIGGIYVFEASVQLEANTRYWAYHDSGSIEAAINNTTPLPGETSYSSTGSNFVGSSTSTLGFQLTATAVPEPSTAALLGLGLAGLALRSRSLRAASD